MSEYSTPKYGSVTQYRKIYTDLEYFSPREYTNVSRYQDTLRLYDDRNGVYYHETITRESIPESSNDTYITVEGQWENRLDIIANNVYGYSLYWWILAIANDIIDPFNVPRGTVLRCPALQSLYIKGSIFSQE